VLAASAVAARVAWVLADFTWTVLVLRFDAAMAQCSKA
jgi:hypothetical protein